MNFFLNILLFVCNLEKFDLKLKFSLKSGVTKITLYFLTKCVWRNDVFTPNLNFCCPFSS